MGLVPVCALRETGLEAKESMRREEIIKTALCTEGCFVSEGYLKASSIFFFKASIFSAMVRNASRSLGS